MQLPKFPIVVLDTETTGFLPRVHKVVEYASCRIESGKVTQEREELFSIDGEIPAGIEALTGILTTDLKGKPRFSELLTSLQESIPADAVIVGQNIGYDLGMLAGEGLDLSSHPWIDTSTLASIVYPEFESYSLPAMTRILDLPHEPKHRALGDVHATTALLSKCIERLQLLPKKFLQEAAELTAKCGGGYDMLFQELLASADAATPPAWLRISHRKHPASTFTGTVPPLSNEQGATLLLTEPLHPGFLQSVITQACLGEKPTWIAVKNLDATLRSVTLPSNASAVHRPFGLLNEDAAETLRKRAELTPAEATLLIKLAWYDTISYRDLSAHGEETNVWSGQLACTEESPAYLAQFNGLPPVVLLEHRHLLHLLTAKECPVPTDARIVIDDASMLEDTVTKALGHAVSTADLRAAATGHAPLTKFIDALQIWVERTRNNLDVRYIAHSDVQSPDAKALRERLAADIDLQTLAPAVQPHVEAVAAFLDPETLDTSIRAIEQRQDGTQFLQSVPRFLDNILWEKLFDPFAVTLLLPPGDRNSFRAILHPKVPVTHVAVQSPAIGWSLQLPSEDSVSLERLLQDPPAGRTIVLCPSKRSIDDAFTRCARPLLAQGIELHCMGFGGGLSRVRGAFIAAGEPSLLLLTPWAYEMLELPPEFVDRLVLCQMPFDHPSHVVIGERAQQYSDSFNDYLLPRMEQRLFRILRTFSEHAKANAEVFVLDQRLMSKGYSRRVCTYLRSLVPEDQLPIAAEAPAKPLKPKKKTIKDNEQMKLL